MTEEPRDSSFEPIDPRTLTATEWDVIHRALVSEAKWLLRRADWHDQDRAVSELQAAAQRRLELARRTVGIRIYARMASENQDHNKEA